MYLLASGEDRGLRHQLTLNLVPQAAAAALLLAGAFVDDGARTALWALALGVDWALTYVTSMRGGGWRLHSVGHFVERHGLMVILALGESIVAIGVGASGTPLDWQLLVGAMPRDRRIHGAVVDLLRRVRRGCSSASSTASTRSTGSTPPSSPTRTSTSG